MIKADFFNGNNLTMVAELFWLQLVVKLPITQKILQELSISAPHRSPDLKSGFIDIFSLFHWGTMKE